MEKSRAIYPYTDESGLSSDALSRDIKIEFCTEDAWLFRTLGLVGKMYLYDSLVLTKNDMAHLLYRGSVGKESPAMQETRVWSLG